MNKYLLLFLLNLSISTVISNNVEFLDSYQLIQIIVTTEDELESALMNETATSIVLGSDINCDREKTINLSQTIIMNNYSLFFDSSLSNGFNIEKNTTLTINSNNIYSIDDLNSTIEGPSHSIFNIIEGSIHIEITSNSELTLGSELTKTAIYSQKARDLYLRGKINIYSSDSCFKINQAESISIEGISKEKEVYMECGSNGILMESVSNLNIMGQVEIYGNDAGIDSTYCKNIVINSGPDDKNHIIIKGKDGNGIAYNNGREVSNIKILGNVNIYCGEICLYINNNPKINIILGNERKKVIIGDGSNYSNQIGLQFTNVVTNIFGYFELYGEESALEVLGRSYITINKPPITKITQQQNDDVIIISAKNPQNYSSQGIKIKDNSVLEFTGNYKIIGNTYGINSEFCTLRIDGDSERGKGIFIQGGEMGLYSRIKTEFFIKGLVSIQAQQSGICCYSYDLNIVANDTNDMLSIKTSNDISTGIFADVDSNLKINGNLLVESNTSLYTNNAKLDLIGGIKGAIFKADSGPNGNGMHLKGTHANLYGKIIAIGQKSAIYLKNGATNVYNNEEGITYLQAIGGTNGVSLEDYGELNVHGSILDIQCKGEALEFIDDYSNVRLYNKYIKFKTKSSSSDEEFETVFHLTNYPYKGKDPSIIIGAFDDHRDCELHSIMKLAKNTNIKLFTQNDTFCSENNTNFNYKSESTKSELDGYGDLDKVILLMVLNKGDTTSLYLNSIITEDKNDSLIDLNSVDPSSLFIDAKKNISINLENKLSDIFDEFKELQKLELIDRNYNMEKDKIIQKDKIFVEGKDHYKFELDPSYDYLNGFYWINFEYQNNFKYLDDIIDLKLNSHLELLSITLQNITYTSDFKTMLYPSRQKLNNITIEFKQKVNVEKERFNIEYNKKENFNYKLNKSKIIIDFEDRLNSLEEDTLLFKITDLQDPKNNQFEFSIQPLDLVDISPTFYQYEMKNSIILKYSIKDIKLKQIDLLQVNDLKCVKEYQEKDIKYSKEERTYSIEVDKANSITGEYYIKSYIGDNGITIYNTDNILVIYKKSLKTSVSLIVGLSVCFVVFAGCVALLSWKLWLINKKK